MSETEIAMELSTLVRRVALAHSRSPWSCPRSCAAWLWPGPREEVAGLTGDGWIEWIESTLSEAGKDFDSATRTALLVAPYARGCRFDVARALAACECWIRRA